MRPKKVLIVDDSRIMRYQLRFIIEKSGYEVCEAVENVLDAMGAYQQYRPDLVTMDIQMPNVDGIEGVKLIKSIDPNAKIIMCSAQGSKEKVLDAIKAGAINFIVKPFEPENFEKLLKSILE